MSRGDSTAEKIRDRGSGGVGMDLRGDLDRGQSGPGASEALSVQSAHSQHLASLSARGPTTVSAKKLI